MSRDPVHFELALSGAVIRLIHGAFLLEGGVAMAREFWSGHPLEVGEDVVSAAALHRKLWNEEEHYPLDWVLRVLDSVEAFCLRYGLDYPRFVEDRILGTNDGCLLSPRVSLRFVGNHLGALLQSPDLRLTLLRLVDDVSRHGHPAFRVRLVDHLREGDRLTAWLLLETETAGVALSRSDLCSWIARVVRHAPCRLGADPFESVEILADTRGVESTLGVHTRGEAIQQEGGDWSLGGKVLTRPVDPSDWLREIGLDPGRFSAPLSDGPLMRVETDWNCPTRGCQVLRKGTLIGAPWGLFRVRWSLDDSSPVEAALRQLILRVTDGADSDVWARAKALHQDLVESDQHRIRFVFHAADETISCNGSHLLRGVPARILQKVLLAHSVTGRTLFEHREFRRDPDLNLDPANPNLESRLRLLAQRLEERIPAVRLEKAGRGRFQLETAIQIEYSEEILQA